MLKARKSEDEDDKGNSLQPTPLPRMTRAISDLASGNGSLSYGRGYGATPLDALLARCYSQSSAYCEQSYEWDDVEEREAKMPLILRVRSSTGSSACTSSFGTRPLRMRKNSACSPLSPKMSRWKVELLGKTNLGAAEESAGVCSTSEASESDEEIDIEDLERVLAELDDALFAEDDNEAREGVLEPSPPPQQSSHMYVTWSSRTKLATIPREGRKHASKRPPLPFLSGDAMTLYAETGR